MKTRNRQSGFTLVEVVVATSLMAVVMLTLFLGLRLGSNAWRRGEQRLEARARATTGLEAMGRQVSAAVPRAVTRIEEQKSVRYVIFSGSASEVRLLTRASWSADRSRPLWLAIWRVERADDDRMRQLTVTESAVTDDNAMIEALLRDPRFRLSGQPELRPESIGEPAENIRFSFLQPAAQQAPAQWVSDWSSRDREELPRGVRVEWTRAGKSETTTFLVPLTKSEVR